MKNFGNWLIGCLALIVLIGGLRGDAHAGAVAQGATSSSPGQLALLDTSGSGSVVNVSFESAGGVPVSFTDGAGGHSYSAVQVSVPSSTAVGLGYQLTQTKPDSSHYLAVSSIINSSAYRAKIKVVSGAITYNCSGTLDGSVGVGNGISSASAAPNANDYALASGAVAILQNGVPLNGVSSSGSGGTVTTNPNSGALTSTVPSVSTATSTTIVSAGTYHYIEIQNNTAANIAISLSGATLTGITAGSGNACIVLTPGQEWHSPPNFVTTGAITAYQTSGSTTNSITVVTG